jgi:Tfp pilus assembly PilM family ATPase|tara:strand:+ start:741 stop:1796 length:1056 start_codon:yes stop_codon:yes gene_type:complete
MFGFTQTMKGCIGIAMQSTNVTIGQCSWRKGYLQNPRVSNIEDNPRNITSQDWRATINDAGLTGTTCSVALPPAILEHHVLQLPEMGMKELTEAVGWELADRLGSDRELLQIDAKRLGNGGDVLGVSIDQATLTSILEPLYAAGLRPTLIEPTCFALTRMLSMRHRRNADRASVRAVLDFSKADSAMMVLAGDDTVFYKRLGYSGDSLIDAVSSHVGVTTDQAALMLAASDQESDEAMSRAVRDATRALHEQIARDAMKCLRHYGVTSRGPIPSELVVTGSAGWNRNLSEILETACNLSVFPDWNIEYLKEFSKTSSRCYGWQIALGTSLSFCESNDRRKQTETNNGGVAA